MRSASILQPPAICCAVGAVPSCGISSRANQATSRFVAPNRWSQACFLLRFRSRTTVVAMAASTIAAISHHTHAGVELSLLDVASEAGDGVGVGVATGAAAAV